MREAQHGDTSGLLCKNDLIPCLNNFQELKEATLLKLESKHNNAKKDPLLDDDDNDNYDDNDNDDDDDDDDNDDNVNEN